MQAKNTSTAYGRVQKKVVFFFPMRQYAVFVFTHHHIHKYNNTQSFMSMTDCTSHLGFPVQRKDGCNYAELAQPSHVQELLFSLLLYLQQYNPLEAIKYDMRNKCEIPYWFEDEILQCIHVHFSIKLCDHLISGFHSKVTIISTE